MTAVIPMNNNSGDSDNIIFLRENPLSSNNSLLIPNTAPSPRR